MVSSEQHHHIVSPEPEMADVSRVPRPAEFGGGDATSLSQYAVKMLDAGLSVIPVMADGSKRPAPGPGMPDGEWKPFQSRRATATDVADWFAHGRIGLAVVPGAVSGNLEVIDFDNPETYLAYQSLADSVGLGALLRCIANGYCEKTPEGYHLLYRCAEIGRNASLARRLIPGDDPAKRHKIEVLIETRGEGGYAIIAPSQGGVHPTGRPYRLLSGGVDTIVTILPEERRGLLDLARSMDEMPITIAEPPATPGVAADTGRPGDVYNAGARWDELLTSAGWTLVYEHGGVQHWRRPGKSSGTSATVNHDGHGLLYVFSTSTALPASRAYRPFTAYAYLWHGGDFSAAARALAAEGYGRREHTDTSGGIDASGERSGGVDDEGDLPTIDVGDRDLPRAAASAWDALRRANEPPSLFLYAGRPARMLPGTGGRPRLELLDVDKLRYDVARSAHHTMRSKAGDLVAAEPRASVMHDMLANPAPPLPVLERVVAVPVVAADGTLLTAPGYHQDARIYYAKPRDLVVPAVAASPSAAEVRAAVELLVEHLLVDFPFDSEASLAHAVAMLVQPFVRELIPGPTPLYLVEKPIPGSGASLLVDVLMWVATGRRTAATAVPESDAEMRKRLTALFIESSEVILFDNLNLRLDSGALAAALTGEEWSDRVLGISATVRLTIRCLWALTANNPLLSTEMTRRSVRIRLNPETADPHRRTGFLHNPLRRWVEQERGRLIGAALTLAQAWIAAGRPTPDRLTPNMGSFENWRDVIGGVLLVAGLPGFLSNARELFSDNDDEGGARRALVTRWWDAHRDAVVSAAVLWPLAADPEVGIDLGPGGERSQQTRFGQMLMRMRDQRYEVEEGITVAVSSAPIAHQARQWQLRP